MAVWALPRRTAMAIDGAWLELGVDVLDLHGRFIHQDADGQRQSAQGHQVDRLPGKPERDHGRHQRQRDIQQDDDRAPPVVQEQQDHQADQHGPQRPLAHDAPDGPRHVGRLVELVTDVNVRRQDGLHVGQGRFHRADHAQRRGVGTLGDQDVDAAAAVDQRVAGGDVGAVLDVAHVPQIDRRFRPGPQRDRFQLARLADHRVDRHEGILAVQRKVAGGADRVALGQGVDDVVRESCRRPAAAAGSTVTTTVRWLPPKGGGAETPGRLANIGRTRNRARSWISPMTAGLAGKNQVAHRHAARVEAHHEGRAPCPAA